MKFKFSFISLIVAVVVILGAFLPFWTGIASSAGILLNVAPENPTPGQNVSITLNSYTNDLDSVLISWSINGKNVSSGIGKKSFSLNAPKAGEESGVVATISLPDGIVETKIMIRPSVVVLLWQANDSYVPPFYKGRALPTPDSEVKVVAMPEIKSGSGFVDSKNMTYAWKKDYNNDQEGSGYGKNSFIYINDYLDNSNNVSVTASTIDQKYSSEANITIGTYQPKIVFYKNDANLGTIWEQALSSGHKIQNEEVMEAAPYFISPKNIGIPILAWNWSINDSLVNILGSRKNLIPLRAQAGVSGTAKIKLEIENKYKIFSTASKEINVEF